MAKLITFPKSYIFVAGHDVYRTFISKYTSSLPVNGNNIAYMKTPENLMDHCYPKDVVDYYREHIEVYSKEAAKVTLLESPLISSLVNMFRRYQKHKHVSQKDFDYLYKKSIKYIKESIDMDSIFYIYLRYYTSDPRDVGRGIDTITNKILNSERFHYRSIYSREEERRIERFDRLITCRLEEVVRLGKFNEIINKKD